MNYRIIHASSHSELQKKVNELIKIGFVPIGGYSLNENTSYYTRAEVFHQTMYKPV